MNNEKTNRVEMAVSLFKKGFNCSQAVFYAYAEGIDKDAALKIASGFGAGIGRMAETCGAVTGACMVLGLKFGGTTSDRESKEPVYSRIKEFSDKFKTRNGSLICRDLLGCDISTSEGLQKAQESKLFLQTCPKFVRDACEILEEMLAE